MLKEGLPVKSNMRSNVRTSRMVDIKIELLFDRITNFVCLEGAVLSCSIARIMAGCYVMTIRIAFNVSVETDKWKDLQSVLYFFACHA